MRIHIISRKGEWAVKKQGKKKASLLFSERRKAIAWAIEKFENATIIVHDECGGVLRYIEVTGGIK